MSETTILTLLIGKTFDHVYIDSAEEALHFKGNGFHYKLYHENNCCEHVAIKDVNGSLHNLKGSPITMAEVTTKDVSGEPNGRGDNYDSATWSFYKFATVKGFVDVSWIGESNGYYSEEVYFVDLSEKSVE